MAKFIIESLGCTHCLADAERMSGLLQQAKFTAVDDIEDAYLIIFNICAVKGPSESAFIQRLQEFRTKYPYKLIVIAGCVAGSHPDKFKKYSLVVSSQIHRIVEVVEETLSNNIDHITGGIEGERAPTLDLPRIRKYPHLEIIPISYGCESSCSFCKNYSGRQNSYSKEEIVKVVKKAIEEGVKEIVLTSHDPFAYGFDINTSLPSLIKELVVIPRNFKIKIDAGIPENLQKIGVHLFPLFNNDKMFKYLSLPIYTGSNKLRKELKFSLNTEELIYLFDQAKIVIPDLTIATEVLSGIPSENDDDHWETQNILRKISPDSVIIIPFVSNSKSPLLKLRKLSEDVLTHRLKVLSDIYANTAKMCNERWLGWEGEVIIEEKMIEENLVTNLKQTSLEHQQWIGRNFAYKPISMEGEFKLGDTIKVKISRVSNFELKGNVVN